jgi:phosphoglycolate phosphatase
VFIERLNRAAAIAPLAAAVPLLPLLSGLRDRNLKLAVATNDAEIPARAHLGAEGVEDLFDLVIGYDSGYGGKPAPGQLLAIAEILDVPPQRLVMVGDSLHDLMAGRAASAATVGVLTGAATARDLAAFADVVMSDIGELPTWLESGCP